MELVTCIQKLALPRNQNSRIRLIYRYSQQVRGYVSCIIQNIDSTQLQFLSLRNNVNLSSNTLEADFIGHWTTYVSDCVFNSDMPGVYAEYSIGYLWSEYDSFEQRYFTPFDWASPATYSSSYLEGKYTGNLYV